MPLPCFGVDITITCHCLHEEKLGYCYVRQYGCLMLGLWMTEFCSSWGEKPANDPMLKLGYGGTCDSLYSYLYYNVFSIYVPASDVYMYHSTDDPI